MRDEYDKIFLKRQINTQSKHKNKINFYQRNFIDDTKIIINSNPIKIEREPFKSNDDFQLKLMNQSN